jgi:deoxyribodipyrimidine photo-lyase
VPLVEAARGGAVVPVFVLDPYFFAPDRAKELPHRIQFLLESLVSLQKNLAELGSRLVVVQGKSTEVVPELAERLGAARVLAQGWVEPFARERDARISAKLGERFVLFEGETLVPKGTVRTGGGTPFSVFTPFARALRRALGRPRPVAVPKRLSAVAAKLPVVEVPIPTLESLGLSHNPRVVPGGERNARERLSRFVDGGGARYDVERDRMDLEGTSRLSADLKFGTLSARTVWDAVCRAKDDGRLGDEPAEKLLNELCWREFSHHTLWDRPHVLTQPFRADFIGFPWREDEAAWQAWVQGKTGYPVVDASARQLLGEGWVHNRARMISASFLTKHLGISYAAGEAHYLRWLVDGDWAQNNAGWQWSAGSGCDAQPYFRVFNPVAQGERFDPTGAYVRAWVPELAKLPDAFIHAPWLAPPEVLARAGVRLGRDYPAPIVDHAKARARFLETAKAHLAKVRAG